MGLDYLMKKVWHPGSMKNIQKVWLAQQKQRQIDRKHLQMKKKLQQQRHNQQLKKLQVQAGLIPRSHLDRMDWMYDWGNRVQNQKNAEQYLTGKPVTSSSKKHEVKQIFKEQITNAKCEDFVLTHEDPMFAILREEKRARQAVMDNPIKMKEIYQSIEGYQRPKEEKRKVERERSKERKLKKDKKKHKKHRKNSSHSRSSTSRSQSRSHSRSRSRDHTKKPGQSQIYKQYLRQRFGPILIQDQCGNLKPDFTKYKKKYKTEYQLSEEEKREMLRQMAENGRRLQEEREEEGEVVAEARKEKKEPQTTGDHFMDVRRRQIERNDLGENLKRDRRGRKYHHDDD